MVEVKEINEFRSSLFKGDGDALDIRRLLTFLLGLKPSLLKLDFGWHIISYFCKDGQDIDVMGLNSLILNDTPTFLSSMDFKKCDMKGIVVDQLKLICLFGMLEYLLRNDVKYNYVRISEFISPFIIDHLKTYSSDVLIQTIALAKLWWTFVCQKVFKENFDASIMRCAKIVCRCVWLHAGSTNGVVQKSVLGFFEHVLSFLSIA
ncbi:unnamed protein product [Heterobilharzia americana]|nr:unnamed protein product [Heterobilharzia americana]